VSKLPEVRINFKRAWRSPGAFYQFDKNIGAARRLASGTVKAANLLASPFASSQRLLRLELLQRRLVSTPQLTPDEVYTAEEFFRAFSNIKVKELTKEMKKHNYVEAIRRHHPEPSSLDLSNIIEKCQHLIDIIFMRLEVIKEYPEMFYPVIASMSRGAALPEAIWFPEFQEAYRAYKNHNKLPQRDALLSPFFVGISLVDIGCGGGDQVAFCGKNHPELQQVVGIDVVNWRTPGLEIDYHVIDFSKPGAIAPAQYDTGLLLAVLHHVARQNQTEKIDTFLQGVRTAVRRRLIVEEDVIVPSDELGKITSRGHLKWKDYNPFLGRAVSEKHGEYHAWLREEVRFKASAFIALLPGLEEFFGLADQPFLDEYVSLDPQSQLDFTIINDYLANALSVGVPQMPFPFGFHTIREWLEIFARNGFTLQRLNVLGFQPGNFNQVCHVHFILDKV
jgi:hypothetical protein